MRRLKWAQTLVQDPAHHTQLVTAMFAKLPSEPNPALGPGGEISPEANPWAVRALFLDRKVAEDFVSMDVTMLRFRSLAIEVPPWDFREEAGHPVELPEEGVPHSGGAVFTNSVRIGSSRSRLWQRMCCGITDKWRWCLDHKSVSSLPRSMEREKRLIVISSHRFVVGFVVIGRVILVKCTSHCLSVVQFAQPNLEIGQSSNSILLNICATFSEMTDFEMPSWGKRNPEEAPQGQGRRAVRQAVAEGRHDRDVTRRLDVLATLSLANAAELRGLTKTYLVPGSESVSEAMAEAGRIYHESAGAIKSKPEAERADAQEQAPEHVAVLKSYWESNVVKSAPVQLAAHVRHCRAKPCKKIEGKEGWTRIVFWLDLVTLPLEGPLEAALQLQKRREEVRPCPKRLLRARSIEAPSAGAREAGRLAHRVEQYSLHMAGLLRRGVLEPSMVYAFLMTKGGQQVPQPKSKAKGRARSREMMSEGVEQTPDVSAPRPQPERPPMVFVRGETLKPSTARPKVRISRKSRPQSIGDPSQE